MALLCKWCGRVSQEDFEVSLVWGAQVLQRIAQQVRSSENRLVMAEKLAAFACVYAKAAWPEAALDEAWRALLLSQHHDCWIVPYNGRRGDTWAHKVRRWTDDTRRTSEEIIDQATKTLLPDVGANQRHGIVVFNTLGVSRTNAVSVALPTDSTDDAFVCDDAGRQLASQMINREGQREVLFTASAPSLGYRTFWFKKTPSKPVQGATAVRLPDGVMRVETDHYRTELDPQKGGTFRSLIAKRLGNRELIDETNPRRLNEIRGFFFELRRFGSNAEAPANIEIVEAGPLRVRLRVTGQIGSHPVTQWVTVTQYEPRIDLSVTIDWQGNPGIGSDHRQSGGFRPEEDRKAFYDDRQKLLALFPLNLRNQKIFKDAPFDVTESRLTNTFFKSWSEIKNNVILHWVDVCDRDEGIGVALLSDHTTSYAHGTDHPLGLTLQYRGVGLWGRNYLIEGPTTVNYALLPHAGDWRTAKLWTACTAWNEPLVARLTLCNSETVARERSLLTVDDAGWEIPTLRINDGKILMRLFNSSADSRVKTLHLGTLPARIELVQLNGEIVKTLSTGTDADGRSVFQLALPPMGIGTLRITR